MAQLGANVLIGAGATIISPTLPAAFANTQIWLDGTSLTPGVITTWTDKSGKGNNATSVGSPIAAKDWLDNDRPCLTLNGVDQYLTADGFAATVSGTDKPFSIAMVYRLTIDDVNFRGVWAFNKTTPNYPKCELYKNNSVGNPYTNQNTDDANASKAVSGGAPSATTTVELVLVCSSTGTAFTSYFNGTIAHNAADVDLGTKTMEMFSIGCLRRGGTPTFFAGMQLCEVVGWNIALSATEAAAEYTRLSTKWARKQPVAPSNVKLWLDANDLNLTSTTWTDRSGQGNNGTLVGTPVISDGWAGSKRMVTFNGTTQYVTADGVASVVSGNDKPFSIAVVYRLTVDTAAYRGLWAFNRASDANPVAEVYFNNTVGGTMVRSNRDDAGSLVGVTGNTTSTVHQISIGSDTGTNFTAWFNDILKFNAVNVDRGVKTLDLFSVGCTRRGGVVAQYLAMELCEVVVWDRALTAIEARTEFRRLDAKWKNPAPPAGGLNRWSVDDIVMGSGSEIATINDRIGTDHLTQGTAIKRATLNATGGPTGRPSMLFDGVDDFYTKSFTFAQPYSILVVAKCVDADGTLVDGNAGLNTGRVYYTGGSIRFYGGSGTLQTATTLTNWAVYSADANGASSSIRVNQGTPVTGSAGTASPSGVTIGIAGNLSSDPANAHIVEVVYCTTASRAAWAAYLCNKYRL